MLMTTQIMQKYIGKDMPARAREAAMDAGRCKVFDIDNISKYLTRIADTSLEKDWTEGLVFREDGFQTPYPYTSFEFKSQQIRWCVIYTPPFVHPDATKEYKIWVFIDIGGDDPKPLTRGRFFSMPLTSRDITKGYDELICVYEADPQFLKMWEADGHNQQELVDMYRGTIWCCQYATLLLGCKNLRQRIETKNTHQGRTKRERKGIPFMDYHILNVPLINKVASGEINPESFGGKIPLNRIRGHFKTYTADKPLFGRHVGRWWWGDHSIGDIEAGIIEKDYSASIPCSAQ